jgi:hypothetical protein
MEKRHWTEYPFKCCPALNGGIFVLGMFALGMGGVVLALKMLGLCYN